ncbi:WD40 repeat 2 [Apiospora hydei]|uniref:WD40 repeat 2 n=1 Tax=Apiospora hydei TaxID=1337664 RepID=A0ABR1XAT8_9PEZI
MNKGTRPDQFFETDDAAAKRERREAKAGNKNGSPIALKSKILGAIADPSNSTSILVAESSGSVRRVNVETGDTKQVYRGPSAPVTCVAVGSPGNQTVFAGSWDKDIWSWNAASKAVGRKYSGHSDFVKAIVCTKLGGKDILISGGADKKIMVWDVESGSRLHVIQDQVVSMMAIQDLALDPESSTADELVLASASSDPHIRRWRIRLDSVEQIVEDAPEAPGTTRPTILEHETTVYKLAFDIHNDDIDLWTASGDGSAKCLSRTKGFTPDETINHGDHVRAVAFTEQWLVTAGRDEDVKVWDRATGKLYCALEGHYDEVTDLVTLANSPGAGTKLVSVSIDGTVRVWALDKSALDKFIQEQQDKADGVEKPNVEKAPEGMMTAEEEDELAALMDED